MLTELMTFTGNFNKLSVKKKKLKKNIFDMFQSVKTGQRQDHLQFATQFLQPVASLLLQGHLSSHFGWQTLDS